MNTIFKYNLNVKYSTKYLKGKQQQFFIAEYIPGWERNICENSATKHL